MKSSLVSTVLLVAVLRAPVANATPAADPAPQDRSAAAVALFHRGLEDMEAGKLAEGCDKLAASVATVPDSGVMGALAECKTALGKLSEAWALWRELSTSAPTAWLRDYAAKNAAALDRRLTRVAIRVRGAAPANLVVTLDGKPVGAGDATEHRVVAGTHVVVAASPEIERWTQTFHARQGAVIEIEIPVAESRNELRRRHRARLISLSLAGAGAAALGVGAVYGGLAYGDWRNAATSCGGSTENCKSTGYESAQSQLASARRAATISSWSTAIGLGAAAAGLIGYLAFRDPSSAESSVAWRATPMAGPQSLGVVLTRSLP